MKNMSPEDLQKMMPGVDPTAAKRLSENPEMLKQSMEMMNAMPEEQRKNMMEQAASMRANGTVPNMGANGMPDMSSMSSVFSNPDMMSSMADMAAKQEGVDPEQAQMMKQVAEQMKSNPELGKQMSDMMKNMPPDQMEEMMKMSKSMKAGQGGSGGGIAPGQAPSMDAMLNNPDMMKAAEDMMKNMSPDMMASMAKSSGIDMDEDKAKMLGKLMPYMPYVLKCMRFFGWTKGLFKSAFSKRGRLVIAAVVLGVAYYQHTYG